MAGRCLPLVLVLTGARTSAGSSEDTPCVPPSAPATVKCTLSVDNQITGMWVDGVSVFNSVLPTTCRTAWATPCTVQFEDKSFSGPQVIALQLEDHHATGNSGSYCTDTRAAGLALACQSSDPRSTWNSVQSDTTSWSSTSTDALIAAPDLKSMILSDSDSARPGWGAPQLTQSKFTCTACSTAIASSSVTARTFDKVWGAGCKKYAVFRKVVPSTCPTPQGAPPLPTPAAPCVPPASDGAHNVTCTFSFDNRVTGLWIDEVNRWSDLSPASCRTDWTKPCTLTFEDESFLAPQLVAFQAYNDEASGDGGSHCTVQSSAGVIMICQSTAPQSLWNDVQSDYTWVSYSASALLADSAVNNYTKFGFDYELAGWTASVPTLSKFTCSACAAPWRTSSKMWGAGCLRNAYFRKVVEQACPTPVDCDGSWGSWGACSASCGSGARLRSFTQTRAASDGGLSCAERFDGAEGGATETRACATSACSMGTVTCTFTVDNDVRSVWVNGQAQAASPSSCLANWATACVASFSDTAHFGQVLAIHGDEKTEDGKILPPMDNCNYYFTRSGSSRKYYWGSALFLACTSTNTASPWHGLVSSLEPDVWSSFSISTADYAAGYNADNPVANGPADSAGNMWCVCHLCCSIHSCGGFQSLLSRVRQRRNVIVVGRKNQEEERERQSER